MKTDRRTGASEKNKDEALYTYKGAAPLTKALPLALQHVVAMIVGCITMPVLISNAVGLSGGDTIIMIQASLFCAAIAIFMQCISAGVIGSGLPVIIGSGFAFLPSLIFLAVNQGVPVMLGAQVIGALVAIIVGIFFKHVRFLFPPLVTACVVITIGISLYPTAVNYMAGGSALLESYGSWQNWLVAIVTLASVVFFSQFCRGILKMTSTLLGMAIGYILALCLGMISFDGLAAESWFQLPRPLHFGLEFRLDAIIMLSIVFIVNAVQDVGQMEATSNGVYGKSATSREISGGVIANNLSSLIGGLTGGVPSATCGQNVGIVVTTKVVNRTVFLLAGAIIMLAALIPKLAGVLTTIPQPVLGGATISVFASIAMTGIRMLANEGLSQRSMFIAGLSIAAAIGCGQVSGEFAGFPKLFQSIFDQSPIVIVTILSILLNLVIPKEKK